MPEDTPTYTIYHNNDEWTEVTLRDGEHVSLRGSCLIIHRVDDDGKRSGRTVYPYMSMKYYHIDYPTHQSEPILFQDSPAALADKISEELRRATQKIKKENHVGFHHTGDIPEPVVPDVPWSGHDGPEVGGPGDVRFGEAHDAHRTDRDPPLGPE